MNEDTFAITEYEQRRLIIDLLIRVTVENSVMRTTLFAALSQGDPQRLKEMRENFLARFESSNQALRASIFEHYGKIDLNDILGPLP